MHRIGLSGFGICVLFILHRIMAITEIGSTTRGGYTCLTCTCNVKTNRNATWMVKFNDSTRVLCDLPINTSYPGSQWCVDVVNATHTQSVRNAKIDNVGIEVSNHVTTICVNQTSLGSYTCQLDDKATARIRMNVSLNTKLVGHRLLINCTSHA